MYTNAGANYGILQLNLWHDFHNKVFRVKHKLHTPDAEKPHAQTSWGDGGTKTKIYCQGTVCQRCVLSVLRTVSLGLTKVGNQAKPLKYSGGGEVVFHTHLEKTFKRVATNLDTQPTMTKQRLTCAHVNTLSYLLWHAYRVICFEWRNQNLTNQIDINMQRFTWAELAHIHLA